MNSICVIASKRIDHDQIREFVESCGGHWNSEPDLDQGVIEKGKARVFISLTYRLDLSYEPDEISRIEEYLCGRAEAVIEIQIGHGEGSKELGVEVARQVIGQWGGYLDDNETVPGSPA